MSTYRITLEKEVTYNGMTGFVELIRDYTYDPEQNAEEKFRAFLKTFRCEGEE